MTPVTRGRNDLWGGLIVAVGLVLAITAFAGVSLFQIGAVGFFTWLALARKQGWAWLPAAFFGFHVAQDLLDGVGGSLFFPLMVVAAGVLMLSRDRLSKNATAGILIMLAVIGIASNNRGGDPTINLRIDRDDPPAAPVPPAPPDAAASDPDPTVLPALGDRELVILAGDIDVELRQARRGSGSVSGDGIGISDDSSDVLIVDVTSSSGPVEVAVPAEASVRVSSTFGDVSAETAGYSLDVDTVSGDVEVKVEGTPSIRAETSDGGIHADGLVDEDDSPSVLVVTGTGTRIDVETVTGEVTFDKG